MTENTWYELSYVYTYLFTAEGIMDYDYFDRPI